MEDVGIFYGHLVYVFYGQIGKFNGHLVQFVVIWYIFPILVCCTKKNLATLSDKVEVKTVTLYSSKQRTTGLPDGIFSNQKSHFG
jgi:hypothetical protein